MLMKSWRMTQLRRSSGQRVRRSPQTTLLRNRRSIAWRFASFAGRSSKESSRLQSSATGVFFAGTLDHKMKNPVLHTRNQWATSKTKIYDTFTEGVSKMHHSKYLHFLFGRVEIQRGQRLQKLFFLVPAAIRTLKGQSLIKDWQEGCINTVDRSGPEAKLQDFSEQVWDEYIGFVEHQYNLSQKPFPLNASGEVMAAARSIIVLLTIIITGTVALVYDGSYSKEHRMGEYDVHYAKDWYVWVLTGF
mmetsp:Transcript_31951/g.74665  ORF Transcript_31951/g.74665 Transcript_31951/m.74665 type:complete len:246 (-) Transcript_31951:15-752(-)